ncbi:hypothetical protein CBM2589_A70352 [Cupriavidus taiwanensis]|uniref:Uncharacterized protein n=1 Tax=Cupriavidus taiwanensis TaxID=164546 RepID=A0A375C7I2_9BURK|nr:hypothetical protein CBM2589_A70352 [Cupriavidus taiwanensis]
MPGASFCGVGAAVRIRAPKAIKHRTDSPKWGDAPQQIALRAILAQHRAAPAAGRRPVLQRMNRVGHAGAAFYPSRCKRHQDAAVPGMLFAY